MARWEPNARGRLEQAAMELFQERGYVRTTVEEIAARAGLTERTFFRYFTDKREVLFSGSSDLQKRIVDATTDAPEATAPLDAVAAALEAAAAALQQHRDESYVRARHALLAAHAELQERELIKLASLTSAVAHALRERGVAEPAASLTAEAGIAVFKVAFERWVTGTEPGDLSQHVRTVLNELRAITAGTARPTEAARRESPRRRRTSK
jgi:AcrR family transcriptional regulator